MKNRKDIIQKLHNKGLNNREIGEKLGLTHERIRQLIVEYNIPRRKKIIKLIQENIPLIITLIKNQIPVKDIAKHFEIKYQTLCDDLILLGYSIGSLKPEKFCSCGRKAVAKNMCNKCYDNWQYHHNPKYRKHNKIATERWKKNNREKYLANLKKYWAENKHKYQKAANA